MYVVWLIHGCATGWQANSTIVGCSMMYVECIHGIDLYRRHLTWKVYHYVYLSVSRVNFWIPQWLYSGQFYLNMRIVLVFQCIIVINSIFLELFTLICFVFFLFEVTLAICQMFCVSPSANRTVQVAKPPIKFTRIKVKDPPPPPNQGHPLLSMTTTLLIFC